MFFIGGVDLKKKCSAWGSYFFSFFYNLSDCDYLCKRVVVLKDF